MARFHYLNKSEFRVLAPVIFKIMRDNMDIIAPSGLPQEEEYCWWNKAVAEGLKEDARQIILITESDADRIIGFLQYYTNAATFMVEEIQIIPAYQRKANFLRQLYNFVLTNIPHDLESIEAYAHKQNTYSISLQRKLGMEIVGTEKNDTLYHLKGKFSDFLNWYTRRKRI